MNLPEKYKVFDFREGFPRQEITEFIKNGGWGVGKYNEKRKNMYVAPQYENRRNIHMGIDIWAPAGEPVFAPLDGKVAYTGNLSEKGNYGAVIVLKHIFDGQPLYALYGHLSLKSLEQVSPGESIDAGGIVGWLGNETENGNWPPHLHFQLSLKDPEEADMPGVVSEDELEKALEIYPDPRKLLGNLY